MASEESDGTPDLTLSFLDVIANGLGCLLILFFLTTVIRTDLAWPPAGATAPPSVESAEDPFVLMVTPVGTGGRLPTPPEQGSPWRIDGGQLDGGQQAKAAAGTQAGWGQDHAILVLDRRPPPNAVVRLYLPAGSEPVECQWFAAAGAGRASLAAGAADPWVQVWPRPEGTK